MKAILTIEPKCGKLDVMPYWFDGNSVIGQPSRRLRKDRETRRAFLQHLSERHRVGQGRYQVFFDGDDPDRSVPPRGVQVRYSAPSSADEAILHGLRGIQRPGEVIVVSNDRDLLTQCRLAGARTMTWKKFARDDRPNISRGPLTRAHDEKVEIDEWIRYFGLDQETLE